MANTYTAVIKRDGEWWIGWIEEVPGVNCQEHTRDELLASLRTALAEALEINHQQAINDIVVLKENEPTEIILGDPEFRDSLIETIARIQSGDVKWSRYEEVF